MEQDKQNVIAMSKQQSKFSSATGGSLSIYKDLIVGDQSWAFFLGFELYNLLFANMGSFFGFAGRAFLLPMFLRESASGVVLGKAVTIRQPGKITFGKKVIIDDFAVLDVRSAENISDREECGIELGDHVLLGRGSIITAKAGNIKLADGCNVGSYCRIATQSKITIAESVLIAAYVYIGPGNHQTEDLTRPIIEQDMDLRGGVTIGANTWIGTRATILDGVTIGRDVIVGAHSLVKEDVPDRAVVAGIPAKVIKIRV